ncbi:MAG: endonuclease domain-containing protein [Prolixibacteraceae bacterium]|nr:endonuclease domain-containing protein [Prolixibacteraceae bacterium]
MTDYLEKLNFGAPPYIQKRANTLRLKQTTAEDLLWCNLRNRKLGGYKFRRQHPILVYIADFYCPEKKLVVEVDGGIHKRKEQREHDKIRNNEMEGLGLFVLRFTNEEVEKQMHEVLQRIREVCEGR